MVVEKQVVSWQRGNLPGPKQAKIVTPEFAALVVSKAKQPLIVVGSQATGAQLKEAGLIDYSIELADILDAPIAAVAHTLKEYLQRKHEPAGTYGVVELVNLLQDKTWHIQDGKKPHDLVVFLGVIYPLTSQVLATLKHFAPHLNTLSIDQYYHPNADMSFPNLSQKEWIEHLTRLHDQLTILKF